MATSPIDQAEFGNEDSVNRQCSGTLFHVEILSDSQLKQASGTPVRFTHSSGRVLWAIVFPAQVLAGELQGCVRQVVIMGADANMIPRVFWHIRHPHNIIDGIQPLKLEEHLFICRGHKPNAPHRKENDWAVLMVDPTWASKLFTLQDGSRVRYSLGGPHGFFRFPNVYPTVPLPALAPAPLECTILGFSEYSLAHAYPGGTTMARRIRYELNRLVDGDPHALLLGRRLRVFTATIASSWSNGVTKVNGPLAALSDARTLPLEERQFAPVQPSILKWPSRMTQGLLKAAQTASLGPLRGAGCKPAFQDRQQVAVGVDILMAESTGPGQQDKPGKGWEGGPWLEAQNMPRFLGMHITSTFQPPPS